MATRTPGKKFNQFYDGSGKSVIKIKVLRVPADFPTVAEADAGTNIMYLGGTDPSVTDNDPTKTNTGQDLFFKKRYVWDSSAVRYYEVGGDDIWSEDGTDAKLVTPQNIDLQSKGLKDNNVITPIKIGDALNTSLNTTNKTFAGGINEVLSKIPIATINSSNPSNPYYFAGLVIDTPGKTSFTISTVPSSGQSFELYLNGVRVPATDYTLVGTNLTWSGIALVVPSASGQPDELTAVINNVGAGGTKSLLSVPDTSANYNNRRVRAIGATGAYRFNFYVPKNFTGALTVKLIGYPVSGAGGTGKDIDLTGEYTNSAGASSTQYTFSDTTSTYNTGSDDTRLELDITSLFSNITNGTDAGILVDHNGIGGTINYLGVEVTST